MRRELNLQKAVSLLKFFVFIFFILASLFTNTFAFASCLEQYQAIDHQLESRTPMRKGVIAGLATIEVAAIVVENVARHVPGPIPKGIEVAAIVVGVGAENSYKVYYQNTVEQLNVLSTYQQSENFLLQVSSNSSVVTGGVQFEALAHLVFVDPTLDQKLQIAHFVVDAMDKDNLCPNLKPYNFSELLMMTATHLSPRWDVQSQSSPLASLGLNN